MERVRLQPTFSGENGCMSIFVEVGLDDENQQREEWSPVDTDEHLLRYKQSIETLPSQRPIHFTTEKQPQLEQEDKRGPVHTERVTARWPSATSMVPALFIALTKRHRLGLYSLTIVILLLILLVYPIARIGPLRSIIPSESIPAMRESLMLISRDAPTDVCKRWSGQSTIVNGTLYMYGFRSTTSQKQTDNTWSIDAGMTIHDFKLTMYSQRFSLTRPHQVVAGL